MADQVDNPAEGSTPEQKPKTPEKDTTTPAPGTRSGEVKVDEGKHYLSEAVVCRGLEQAVEKIAATARDVKPGGILIVDELDFAVQEIHALDIRSKLDALYKWAVDVSAKCDGLAERAREQAKETILLTQELKKGSGDLRMLSADQWVKIVTEWGAAGTSFAAGAVGITAGLKAAAEILSYFKTDYELKGQTLEAKDDLYIQALVAGKMSAMQKEVYLFKFNMLAQSQLINDFGKLMEQKYQMLTCAGALKGLLIDGKEAQIQALQAHLASLRASLLASLVKVDEQTILDLRKEIDQTEVRLKAAHGQRTPDTQVTALETYQAGLRAKLAEELARDPETALAAVEAEINKIVKQLEGKDDPQKKLSEVQADNLKAQLTLLRARKIELVVGISQTIKAALNREIDRVSDLLKKAQLARLPDAEVIALETHLASLRAKLAECLAKNDKETVASLEKEVAAAVKVINTLGKSMNEAAEIVSNSNTVSAAIDAFITNIATAPTGGGYPPLVNACLREHLQGDQVKYLLKIKLASSGADLIIEKPPFWRRDPTVSYIGGGVVSFILAEKEGRIAASGTVEGIAALEHRMGQEPRRVKWKVHAA